MFSLANGNLHALKQVLSLSKDTMEQLNAQILFPSVIPLDYNTAQETAWEEETA